MLSGYNKKYESILSYLPFVTFLVPCAYLIGRIIFNDSVQAAITVPLVPQVSAFYHITNVNRII